MKLFYCRNEKRDLIEREERSLKIELFQQFVNNEIIVFNNQLKEKRRRELGLFDDMEDVEGEDDKTLSVFPIYRFLLWLQVLDSHIKRTMYVHSSDNND